MNILNTTTQALRPLYAPAVRARRWRFEGVLVLLMGLGLIFAAPNLRFPVRLDEPYTANMAHLGWAEMWANLYHDTPNPLIYVFLNGWTRLAGESALALRLPALICFALTIWVTGQLARRLGGAWAGVAAAVLVAASTDMGAVYAAQGRPYGPLGLLAALSAYLGCALLELFPVRRRALLALALVGVYVLGVLMHPVFAVYAIALTLAGLWRSGRHFALLAGIGAAAALVYLLLMLPVLRVVLPLPSTAWMRPPTWQQAAAGIWRLWSRRSSEILGLALMAVVVVRARRAGRLARQTGPRVIFTLAAVTFGVVIAISLVKPIYVAERTSILWLPAACVLAALLLTRLDTRRWLTRAALAAMLSVSAAEAAVLAVGPNPQRAEAAIAAIGPELQCSDQLIAGGLAYNELVYFLRRAGRAGCGVITTFPAETIVHSGWLAGMPEEALVREAAETAERLSAEPGIAVWYFSSTRLNRAANDTLKAALDQALGEPELLSLNGFWFNRVYVYRPRG